MIKTKMPQGYSKEERELHVNFLDGDDFGTVYTSISTYATKLKKAKAELLEYEYYTKSDGSEVQVGWKFKIEPSQLSFRTKKKKYEEMTDEEKAKYDKKVEASRERMKKMHSNKGDGNNE